MDMRLDFTGIYIIIHSWMRPRRGNMGNVMPVENANREMDGRIG